MFSHPTVFVIGAGASAEFGMPSGPELKRRIGATLDFRQGGPGQLLSGDKTFYEMLGARFGGGFSVYHEAANELSRICREVHFESIDEALHWFSSSPEAVALGKATIVREILAAERSCAIYNADNPERIRNIDDTTIWTPSFPVNGSRVNQEGADRRCVF
jgi:hypothetical protein